MDERDTMELPCTVCGNAAVQVNLRPAVEIVPVKMLFTIKGMLRAIGRPLDVDLNTPRMGIDPQQVARFISAVCIECVDRAAVDNKPENAK